MVIGLGLDITTISRIWRAWNKFGTRFARKILHPLEMETLETHANAAQFLASRFAAKEAAVKALGTGFSNGIVPPDICVETLPGGKPELRFYGKAQEYLAALGADRTHLSLTHDKETVAAVVILEKA
ncbi:holo-ACP synthase [Desulfovibrio sp. OttesenSCG-928-O18]|nr:holo-ACP synthase [Desulfovibrio sp. OttesenSCG-928-O18]